MMPSLLGDIEVEACIQNFNLRALDCFAKVINRCFKFDIVNLCFIFSQHMF